MRFGIIAATKNSIFYVFTKELVNKVEKFNLLTKWSPQIEKEVTFKKNIPTPLHNF